MKYILYKMGVISVFDYNAANLSGLLNSTERLNVADVLHNVIIEVNEEHTEAAAYTGCILLKRHFIYQRSQFRPIPDAN